MLRLLRKKLQRVEIWEWCPRKSRDERPPFLRDPWSEIGEIRLKIIEVSTLRLKYLEWEFGAHILCGCSTIKYFKLVEYELQTPILSAPSSDQSFRGFPLFWIRNPREMMDAASSRFSFVEPGHHPQISTRSNFFHRRRRIAKVYIFEKLRIFSFDWCYFQTDSGTFWKPGIIPIKRT